MKKVRLILCLLTLMPALYAQDYTYQLESFEDEVWTAAASNSITHLSRTGLWTVAKNNVSKTEYAASGQYSLYIATKTAALTTPKLPYGAGALRFKALRSSGGSRVVNVSSSSDGNQWLKRGSFEPENGSWSSFKMEINDPSVRYLRFELNSNGSLYLDDIELTRACSTDIHLTLLPVDSIGQNTAFLRAEMKQEGDEEVTRRGFCLAEHEHPTCEDDAVFIASDKVLQTADRQSETPNPETLDADFSLSAEGLTAQTCYYVRAFIETAMGINYSGETSFTTRPADVLPPYFIQDYNQGGFPAGNGSEERIVVAGQGEWLYMNCKKNTNASYIPDASAASLRMPKNGSYLVTPLLERGVERLSYVEGRGNATLTLYVSSDGGQTWSQSADLKENKGVEVVVNLHSAQINRLKLVNGSDKDADIDNLCVWPCPQGEKASLSEGRALSVGRNGAEVQASLLSYGDGRPYELGFCWDVEQIPYAYDDVVKVEANDWPEHLTDSWAFAVTLAHLPAGTRILYRAYAKNAAGVGYGPVRTCVTEDADTCRFLPLIVHSVTASTAVVTLRFEDFGGDVPNRLGLCRKVAGTSALIMEDVVAELFLTDEEKEKLWGNKTIELEIQGLEPNEQYLCRAFAENRAGLTYSPEYAFETGSLGRMEVRTEAVENATSYSLEARVRLLECGNTPVELGLLWSERPIVEPSQAERLVLAENQCGNASEFQGRIGCLQPATLYYVRAYADNGYETVMGEEMTLRTADAAVYYLSPDGDDLLGDGSEAHPWYSLSKVVDLVNPGDRIYMGAGVYRYRERIQIGRCGESEGGSILLAGYGGRAVLDFSQMADEDNNQGIRHSGSFWHYLDIDIVGAGDNGLLIERNKPSGGSYSDVAGNTDQAHHNVIERCRFYRNRDTGLQLKNLASYNLILYCDSYFNRDSSDGDADGFAPKITVGNGNYFYGCRAWNNSDDGWDSFLKCAESGFPDDVYTVVENCWAFRNGFLSDNTQGNGNGNGFKLGGNYERHNMILLDCLAFDNLQKSFDQNHNAGDMTLINCSAFDHPYNSNKSRYQYRIDEADVLAAGKQLSLYNCVAVWDGKVAKETLYSPVSLMDKRNESNCRFTTEPRDYASVDTAGVTGERLSDGSLPEIPFMTLREGSPLCDVGVVPGTEEAPLPSSVSACLADICLQLKDELRLVPTRMRDFAFSGLAPDLGCFEFIKPSSLESRSTGRFEMKYARNWLYVGWDAMEQGTSVELRICDLSGRVLECRRLERAGVHPFHPQPGVYLVSLRGTGLRQSFRVRVE